MEEATLSRSGQDKPNERQSWPDWSLLAVLLFLAVGIHAWLLAHTEVAARDSIGYIRFALKLQEEPWRNVVRSAEQHPLYPFCVLAVSLPVRHYCGGVTCDAMTLSCQLVSCLAGVLLVFPMFYLGKEFFDRRVGFWAAALFQLLPISAHVTADALTESVFLLFTATALLLAVRALREPSIFRFVSCGLVTGLIYLTRPEGVFTWALTLAVLLGSQAVPAWRRSWDKTFTYAASLTLAALLVAGPYMKTIGGFTNKPTPNKMLDLGSTAATQTPQASTRSAGPLLAVWWRELGEGSRAPLWWGLWALGFEVARCFHYVVWLPVLLGMWWFRGLMRTAPGAWVVLGVCLLQSAILVRMAMIVGYLSERHVQLLVMCGTLPAVAVILAFGDWLTKRGLGRWPGPVFMLALIGFGMSSTLKPLHANRAGHRAAGLWLAEHAQPTDRIDDPFCWAHFYAGMVFLENKTPPREPGYEPRRWVVLEESENQHSRLPMLWWCKKLAGMGTLVYEWQPQGKHASTQSRVRVYQVPRYDWIPQ